MSMSDAPPPRIPVHPVLWAMIAVMVGFELMFAAVEAGYLPENLGRAEIYLRFAFFGIEERGGQLLRVFGEFDGRLFAEPLGPAAAWSFLTYAFLHGGWLHLAMNGAAFMGLGHALVQRVGILRFLAIFAVTSVAGAVAFWLMSPAQGPMVGASGAIFGMLAVLTAWQEQALRRMGMSRAPIWQRIGGLVLLNVLLALGLGGLLAWEAHLGGFACGWLMALAIRPGRGPAFAV